MSDQVTYYDLLNVSREASAEEIRSAYRAAIRTVHPDVGGNGGMFRLVQQAYETLSDPAERVDYDAWLDGMLVDEPDIDAGAERSASTATDDAGDRGASGGSAGTWWWGQDEPASAAGSRRKQGWVHGRGGFTITVISSSVMTVLYLVFAFVLVARPDVIRPDAAESDLIETLLSVWWLTALAAVAHGLVLVGSTIEINFFEAQTMSDCIMLAGFLVWPLAYWDIATSGEHTAYVWALIGWVIYRVSVLVTTLMHGLRI